MAAVATESVLGLFKDPDSVANALDGLRAANFDGLDLKVLADTPYPEGAFGEEHEGHRLYVFPFIGAICGLTVGILLTIGTQLAYPMVTGGKPVLSIPPIVHILYEGTMLGAVALMTRRHLERRFLSTFGIGPKRLARIARFQRALRVLDQADPRRRGTITAAACGYADQSHFIREFRALAGCSPAEHLVARAELTGFFVSRPRRFTAR